MSATAKHAATRPDPAELHEALQLGNTAEVAAHFRVNRRTVYDWVKRPEYQAFLADLQRAAWAKVAGEAAKHIKLAIDTAAEITDSDGVDPHARLSASRLLLETHTRLAAAADAAGSRGSELEAQGAGLADKVKGLLGIGRKS